jgi:glycosyltransferase involved in cell wall biosynthesis
MNATQTGAIWRPAAQVARSQGPPIGVWMYDPWCRTPWYTASLTRALAMDGHAVRLVCPSYVHEPKYLFEQGLVPRPGVADLARYTAFRKLGQPARLAEYLVNTVALRIASTIAPPQILHLHQCVLLERGWRVELAFLRWCRRRGVKIVHTVHNLLPHLTKPFHESLYTELYHMADALICHDDETAGEVCRKFNISRSRIHVAPHGPLFGEVPEVSPVECRKVLGLKSDSRIFLALGVLAHYKGLDVLLEAWADLIRSTRSRPLPVLVIAGNGPAAEKGALEELAGRLGLNRETLRLEFRYIPASQIPLYQHAADVLLYPYRNITTSGALLTGLNYCKPIVASQLPPFRDYLFSGENAILVPPGDRGELAQALQTMMEPSCYARLKAGSAGNPDLLVQWREISAQVADVYRSVLA